MMNSKYEKYIVRKPKPADLSIEWGRKELGIVSPFNLTRPTGPIKEPNAMVEFTWINKDCASGVTPQKSPHKHDCEELFIFLGTNPEEPDALGAEVEFWLGEGEEMEKLLIDSTSLVYIPKGLLHMPIFYRNVIKPSIRVVIALNAGETLKDTVKYPVRGL